MIAFLKFLQFCFRIIFFAPAGIALFLMRAAAWLTQSIAKRTKLRSIVKENIKTVLPQSKINRTSDKLIENISHSIFEVLCVPFFKKKHFRSVIKWGGLEHLKKALEKQKGVIILTMHAGNYEIIPMGLANLGYKINTVLRATPDPVFEIVNNSRSAGGVKLINVLKEDMYKETLNLLNNNELVFLLADTGALDSRHAFIDFLGHKVPAATGWLTLAQRSGCLVVPTISKKEKWINTITLHEPVSVTKENRQETINKVSRIFEKYIRENPEQWAIFLNSYETQRMVQGK